MNGFAIQELPCPECPELAQPQVILEQGRATSTTHAYAIPIVDKQGRKHIHDTNKQNIQYQCPNGHYFKASALVVCWCGWQKEQPTKGQDR